MHQQSAPTLFEFFVRFYRPYKFYVLIFVLCAGSVGLHGIANSYFTKRIIDALVSADDNPQFIRSVIFAGVFIILTFEMHNLCWRTINYVTIKIAPVIRNQVVTHVFQHVHAQSPHFFSKNPGGSISAQITILSENMERIASTVAVRLIKGAVQLFAALLVMYAVHSLFSIGLLIWVIGFIAISWLYSKKIRRLSAAKARSESQVAGKMVDSVSNFSSVRLFSGAIFESAYLGRFLRHMKRRFRRKERFLLKFYLLQGFSITLLMAFMFFVLIYLYVAHQVSIGDFALILGCSLAVTDNVWRLTERADEMHDAVGKCNQCLESLFSTTHRLVENPARQLIVSKGHIAFENVQFHYAPSTPLFENTTIIIPPGQKVGLVGLSGSGKSTFLSLIARLYDPVSGRILIDGQDLCDVAHRSVHSQIGIVTQDPILFHRSLLENIRYGRLAATDEEVIRASKLACVKEFADRLPHRYHSLLGERGANLSGGQRQRIAIARVFLKDAPILILDEATSHLDSVTESIINASLGEFMEGRTTLIASHRLSTLSAMDRLLVFNQGAIVEDGTHHQLLMREQGTYRRLWQRLTASFGVCYPT
jgi:ATP-binding cassette, subfamily B, bacterial